MGEVKVNGIEYLDFNEGRPADLIAAISKIYYIFYDVDLRGDCFIKYHASKVVSAFTDRYTSAHDCLQGIPEAMFVPEHRKMIADFYESSTWPERLKEKDMVYLDAVGVHNGWIRTNLIVAARDDNGIPSHVIIAIQGVNDTKMKEIAQNKQLEAQLEEITSLNDQLEDNQAELEAQVEEVRALNLQLEDNQAELEAQLEEIRALNMQLEENQAELEASAEEQAGQLTEIHALNDEMVLILQSLADIYYSMHLIDLEKDTVIAYKALDEVEEIVDHLHGAVQMMKDVIRAVAVDEYLAPALMFTDLTTLRQRMKDTRIITAEFIGKRIGWSQASFITVKTDKDGMPVEVMFVTRCIDPEKKKEEALIRSSNTDGLTDLLNRRAYENAFNAADVLSADLVYVAMDVNGLKRVNDTLGHAAGDELIIGAADCMRKSFGKYGDVFRTGGDEFAAIIHTSMDELEKIKSEFESLAAGWSGKFVDKLHIAAGYASAAQDKDCGDLHQMSILADKRMYENKSAYYRQSGVDRRKR